MDPTPRLEERPRKRRAINACLSCRASKVRCDGKRPCARCDRNDTACTYHDAARDENVLRIEKLEADMAALQDEMNRINIGQGQTRAKPGVLSGLPGPGRQGSTAPNVVDAGLVTWEQAAMWFER